MNIKSINCRLRNKIASNKNNNKTIIQNRKCNKYKLLQLSW